jgi:flagellar biosynthesis protein FliR
VTLQLEPVLAQALFVGLRVSMLMVFAPFFGSVAIPGRIKAVLTFLITALLYPQHAAGLQLAGPVDWARVVGGELVVGLAIGLTVHFVFEGTQLAGQVIGFQLGFSLANLIDPQTQVDTPVMSVFHQAMTLLIFLQLNVHHWVLRGLAKSFEYLPPGRAAATPAATEALLQAAGSMLVVAVQIAGPALVATVLADIALGYIGKAAPALPVLFVGLSVKSLLGLAVVMGTAAFWPTILEGHFLRALGTTERLLRLVR